MNCPICRKDTIDIIYDDYIRDGGLGTLTKDTYKMYQCNGCKTIWHSTIKDSSNYYQTTEYRQSLERAVDVESYHKAHDKEVLEKLQYTGTDIYRDKIVADIGCGGGSFLDFISGVAGEIISIEPSAQYRSSLEKKGYHVFAYASEAIAQFKDKVDVVTSFDVIEHVDSPIDFMRDVHMLLKPGGVAVIGTPSDCPVMRKLLGKVYEQKLLFSYQHPWILSRESIEICCREAGFKEVRIQSKQRYGISNLISWLSEREAKGHMKYDFISDSVDDIYKGELSKKDIGDYWVCYVRK